MVRKMKLVMAWTLVALIAAFLIYCMIVGIATAATETTPVLELIAEAKNGKVQLYQYGDCYMGVGYLHGYTIALDCDR